MKLQRLLLERGSVPEEWISSADSIIARRIKGEPLQYILGQWEFYGMPFYVGEGVLIPRADTETLAEYAIETAEKYTSPRVIDLCSGSGCVAVAAASRMKNARVCAAELSGKALSYLRRNAELNRVDLEIIKGDVLKRETVLQFDKADIILCNPPYLTAEDMRNLQQEVRFEPETALYGGEDGLCFYREIACLWKDRLNPGGVLAFEIGRGQEADVEKILRKNGFENIELRKDLAGIIRVVSGTAFA